MSKDIVDLFKQSEFQEHPVWILLGDLEITQPLATKMVESVSAKVGYYDIHTIELSRATLPTLNKFLALHSLNVRIMTCILRTQDEYLNAAILKTVEDVPENTVFIILAQSLDPVLYNRGLVFKFDADTSINQEQLKLLDSYSGFEGFLDGITDYETLPDTINHWLEQKLLQAMRMQERDLSKVMYKVWCEFAEIRSWIRTSQIGKAQASEMMLSMLEMGHLIVPSSNSSKT